MPWQFYLSFLVPLAVALGVLAWLGHGHTQTRQHKRYLALAVAAWLAASAAYFLVNVASLHWAGKTSLHSGALAYLREFAAFTAAYFVPFVALGLLLSTAGHKWSREAHVMWAVSVGAFAAFLSPILIVLSACWLQGNCL